MSFSIRVWGVRENKWMVDGEMCSCFVFGKGKTFSIKNNENYIAQLSTGIKDINGVEIFEGDYIEVLEDNLDAILNEVKLGSRFKVILMSPIFYCVGEPKIGNCYGGSAFNDLVNCDCHNANLKIIGNIFQGLV